MKVRKVVLLQDPTCEEPNLNRVHFGRDQTAVEATIHLKRTTPGSATPEQPNTSPLKHPGTGPGPTGFMAGSMPGLLFQTF